MTIYGLNINYPVFTDFDGTPLQNGYIYFGEENRNPLVYPITVYYDKDYLTAVSQPLRTTSYGNPSNGGSPSTIYTSVEPFSILILDASGNKVHYNPSITGFHQTKANTNLIVNGNFELFGTYYQSVPIRQGPDNIYNYIAINYQWISRDFSIGGLNKKYLDYYSTPGNVEDATKYGKFLQIIEDIYTFNNQELTLSFYFRCNSIEHFKHMSVSIDTLQGFSSSYNIFSEKIKLGLDWEQYETTFKVPKITSSEVSDPYPDETETGLIINLWVFSGSDYYGETDFLENPFITGSYDIQISNLKLEFGDKVTQFINPPLSYTHTRFFRRIETTFDNSGPPQFGNQSGYIEYVSPGIQSFIPGFKFRQRKRTTSPTVRIYSYATKDEGKVTLVGTGDIDVSSVDDIFYDGVGQITLASNTAAGNVYKYHYIVEDEFTL